MVLRGHSVSYAHPNFSTFPNQYKHFLYLLTISSVSHLPLNCTLHWKLAQQITPSPLKNQGENLLVKDLTGLFLYQLFHRTLKALVVFLM